MGKLIDLTDKKFGYLLVIKRVPNKSYGNTLWLCKCDCGNQTIVQRGHLLNSQTISCGCFKKTKNVLDAYKHGYSKSKIYKIWNSMIQRCNNPNSAGYQYYGKRGIKVCDEWLKFENFFRDMGERPKDMSIDRIDNNGNYCKENCRWANNYIQKRNTNRNIFAIINGRKQCISDWCKELDLNKSTIISRIQKGLTPEEAITKDL